MTGLRPSTTGIYGLSPWYRDLQEWRDVISLPRYLGQNGYFTYSTGKVYHGGYGRRDTDEEFDVFGPMQSVGPRPERRLVDTPSGHPSVDWGTFPHLDEDKGDWNVATWAVEQLEGGLEEPFFLAVGFSLPHVPLYVTDRWYDMYPEETIELPPILREDRDDTPRFSWYLHWKVPEPRLRFVEEADEWRNLVRSYLASTSFMDSQVGRVLEALEARGLEENTIVVLWSDHGYHLGEKLITGKNTLWDRSTRVPLIFAGPGVAAGARCHRSVELLDIYPTLVELTGLAEKDGLEGISLAPQLTDSEAPRARPAITTHNRDNHGVRSERWRYVRYADGSEELYDMMADPNEWDNLAGDSEMADVLEQHRRWLPAMSAMPAPGSRGRILTYEDGVATWQGQRIGPSDPIPEI
jgi:arylsulfatase A-like enzyme